MKIKIKNKEYTMKIGNRAMTNLSTLLDKDSVDKMKGGEYSLSEEDDPFSFIVKVAWAAIRDKKGLKYEDLDDYLDTDTDAFTWVSTELAAYNSLKEEAKK